MTAFRSRYLKQGRPARAVQGAAAIASVLLHARYGPLVLLDATPIRAEARKKYKQARDRFAELQRLAARFHQEDKPKYEQWLQANFGPFVAELRAARAEVNRLRDLIFEVETRTWLNSQSSAAAYRDILERELKRRAEEQAKGEGDDQDKKDEEGPTDAEASAEDDAEEGQAARAGGRRGPKLPAEKEARLKSAYRALVRRLHPDHNTEVTPLMRERWHAAQQAYHSGDLELLESIETLCLGDEEDESALLKGQDIPVSHILDRAARLGTSIGRQTQKVMHLKKDAAWSFAAILESDERLDRLHRHTAKTLPNQIQHARAEVAELEVKVAQWQHDAERFYPGFKEAHPKEAGKKGTKAKAAPEKHEKREKPSKEPKEPKATKGKKGSKPSAAEMKAKAAAGKAKAGAR